MYLHIHCTYVCLYVCMHICVHVFTYTFQYVLWCIHVELCVDVCVCVRACACVFTEVSTYQGIFSFACLEKPMQDCQTRRSAVGLLAKPGSLRDEETNICLDWLPPRRLQSLPWMFCAETIRQRHTGWGCPIPCSPSTNIPLHQTAQHRSTSKSLQSFAWQILHYPLVHRLGSWAGRDASKAGSRSCPQLHPSPSYALL